MNTMYKLEKLNSSLDVIPLQSSSGENRPKSVDRQRQEISNKNFRDPLLISRVQSKKYRNYRDKKRSPFRAVVRRAYDEITESFARKSNSSDWQEDEDEDDNIDVESDPQDDTLNNELLKMYKKNLSRQNGNSSDKELIDISSDDDQSKIEEIPSKKANDSKKVSSKVQKDNVHSCSNTLKPLSSQAENESIQMSTSEMQVSTPIITEKLTKKRQREKDSGCGQSYFIKKKKEIPIAETTVKFADIGGCTKVLEAVCKLLIHIKHPEVFKQLGISPPRGFLLHGPPGCGKTLLAYAIAGELEIPLLTVAAPELIAGVSGESEARVRELFDQAIALAPCVLLLDEVDAVAPHRATTQKEMERRIVAQLLSCLDQLSLKDNGDKVLVLGATNRPDSLDPALRRAGRFDREISLGIPDEEARAEILAVHAAKLALAPDVSLAEIAALTPGFVGADIVALIREAAMVAVSRVFGEIKSKVKKNKELSSAEKEQVDNEKVHVDADVRNEERSKNSESEQGIVDRNDVQTDTINSMQTISKSQKLSHLLTWLHDELPLPSEYLAGLFIENGDFEAALHVVQPSAKREGFATVPDVTWDDVGSLQDIRQELQMAILAPVRHSEHFATLGLTTATGVLLCGPPGCGKTLLAKAIANEAGINFISVKGPELLNMYVGESEKAVRQCFIRARNSAPCVIFFDELDSLCPKRSEGDCFATSRVVNQMLTEMDGVEARRGVFLMAASNRPDIIDPAVLRPGRLDKILYVGLPTARDRVDILKALTKNGTKPRLAADVNLAEVVSSNKCDGYTGADLAALVREAGVEALRELLTGPSVFTEISMRHIHVAFNKIRPSVHEKDIKYYEKLRKLYSVTEKSSYITLMETPVDAPRVDTIVETMKMKRDLGDNANQQNL